MPSVLVADDENGFRTLLGWRLAGLGLRVITVPDGQRALDLLTRESFDLIITDLTMPLVQGLALVAAAKQISPESEVIVITGFATVDTAVQAMQAGAHDVILKPFDLPLFLKSVTGALAKACPDFEPPPEIVR